MSAVTTAVPSAFLQVVSIDYWAVLPLLIVFGGAVVGVLVEAFAPRRTRYPVQVVWTLLVLVAAVVVIAVWSHDHQTKTFGGSVVVDGPTLFLQGSLLVLSILAVLTMAERYSGKDADAFTPMGAATPGSPYEAAAARAGLVTTEVFPLALLSVGGMMLFPAAGDLITMFVALEVLSLPLYILSGLARRRRLLSQEASLKYFLLGAFSSAFFLFGAALLFAYSGSLDLVTIASATTTAAPELNHLLLPGVLLVLVGLLFKVGAVPFHSWTPDVYQGAPTPITGFMAACTKAAAVGAILRVSYTAFDGSRWDWRAAVIAVAILTMVVGAVLSVTQTDMKRLLAYSSIAHAGFVLVGIMAFDRNGVAGTMFYVAAYGLTVIAAFAVVTMVRENGSEATHLSQWAGLGKDHPVVAGVFAFILLAFAGIPLTSGFTAKYAVFAPAVADGGRAGVIMVVVGVLASAVTAYVYVRIIILMYFTEVTSPDVTVLVPSPMTTVAVTVGVLLTFLLGVVPGPVLGLAVDASQFIR